MSRIGVVINPTAGHGRAQAQGPIAKRLLEEAGHDIVDLSSTSLASAKTHVRQAIVDGLDAVVVVGGDGMVHLGVNVVAGTSLPLGIVAAGTGNDISRGLGLPIHDVAASVEQIEAGLRTGGRQIDAVSIGDPESTARQWFLGVLSAGIDAAVNERANAMRWPRGELRYIRALLVEAMHMKPYDYRVTIDGEVVWDAPGLLAAVANGTSIGGGLLIAPGALFDDGELQVVMVEGVSRVTLARVFPRLYKGTHVDHPAVHIMSGKSVLIEAGVPAIKGGTPKPPPIAYADGERIGPAPLRCDVEPGAVTILRSARWEQDRP